MPLNNNSPDVLQTILASIAEVRDELKQMRSINQSCGEPNATKPPNINTEKTPPTITTTQACNDVLSNCMDISVASIEYEDALDNEVNNDIQYLNA